MLTVISKLKLLFIAYPLVLSFSLVVNCVFGNIPVYVLILYVTIACKLVSLVMALNFNLHVLAPVNCGVYSIGVDLTCLFVMLSPITKVSEYNIKLSKLYTTVSVPFGETESSPHEANIKARMMQIKIINKFMCFLKLLIADMAYVIVAFTGLRLISLIFVFGWMYSRVCLTFLTPIEKVSTLFGSKSLFLYLNMSIKSPSNFSNHLIASPCSRANLKAIDVTVLVVFLSSFIAIIIKRASQPTTGCNDSKVGIRCHYVEAHKIYFNKIWNHCVSKLTKLKSFVNSHHELMPKTA